MIDNGRIISIIVPIYNTEKYVRDCMDSLLLMQNINSNLFEIICINDGSTDASASILDQYASRYSNVTVIHQQNAGVSAARNHGIEAARGKYLWFVDSDDCIRPNCLSMITQLLKEHAPQMLRVDYAHVSDGYDFRHLPPLGDAHFKTYAEPDEHAHTLSACFTLFCKDLIIEKNIRFLQGMKYAEDTLFALQVLEHASKPWIYLQEEIYFYRTVASSTVHQTSKEDLGKHIADRFRVLQYCVEHQQLAGFRGNIIRRRIYLSSFNILINLPKSNLSKTQTLAQLRKMKCFPLKWNAIHLREATSIRKKVYTVIHMLCFRSRILYNGFYFLKKTYNSLKSQQQQKSHP